ncbi:mannosylglucosyl-3-phosphoglycerate phosphatase-like isoform X2 [Macrobrachium nipponense]|uniref:mannosylglucosyl-3-phosphoglycerate phosphatase-like isoform X2 n=1 Tax=Macrobrachium nipponense TaxID=159736 RepID=UPI0030C7AE81
MGGACIKDNSYSNQTTIMEAAEELNGPKDPSIVILHFNDIYNVEEQNREPRSGAPRFKTALKSFQEQDPLILFSGDILAPSITSTFTKGEQMVPVMNQFGIHCAVFGNHDFDFGLERLIDVKSRTQFPWLMSNVVDNETEKPLADGIESITLVWHGWKIGLIGLVEWEWLETLATINCDQVTFTDYVDRGRELATNLKNEGCDYIIALTHMRTPNDIRLAENVDEIDLILGGHDHVYEITKVNGKTILKSGTDFREFSAVTLTLEEDQVDVKIHKVVVDSNFDPDEELLEALKEYEELVGAKMDEVLGTFSVDLDGRFSSVRTSETSLGNFICDIIMAACNADVAIINSGTLRSDRIHEAGEFTMRDLMTVLPMLDPLLVLEITGEQLLEVLENGVSQYPKLEGRFPQVAGVSFVFDPQAPSMHRVIQDIVKVGDEYLIPNATYRLATKAYMHQGRDGYHVLTRCPVLQDEEQCPMLSTAIQNHFTAIKTRMGMTRRNSSHRQSLILLSRSDDEVPVTCRTSSRTIGRSLSTDSALAPVTTAPCTSLVSAHLKDLSQGGSIMQTLNHETWGGGPPPVIEETPASCVEDLEGPCFGDIPAPPREEITAALRGQHRRLSGDLEKSASARRLRGALAKQESVNELEDLACKLAPEIEGRIQIATDELIENLRQEKTLYSVTVIDEEDELSSPLTPEAEPEAEPEAAPEGEPEPAPEGEPEPAPEGEAEPAPEE